MKLYKVGGYVRDSILGIPSKDIDYSVEANSFEEMKKGLLEMGVELFPIPNAEKFMTLRGKLNGEAVDFVLCRKDGYYSDGRRPDQVEMGSIFDDLARRDFTMNAIAISYDDGEFVDPHGGFKDIKDKRIRCVGSTDRLKEDSLRMLRAMRFSITKDFVMEYDIIDCIEKNFELLKNVSRERIFEEMNKMFNANSAKTFKLMIDFQKVFEFIFEECKVNLNAILKEIK